MFWTHLCECFIVETVGGNVVPDIIERVVVIRVVAH